MTYKLTLPLLIACLPALAGAAWQTLSTEQGKKIEIDRASIKKEEGGKSSALGRIVLDKPISDPRTSSSYRIIEALSRYDCAARTYTTLKRSYFKEEGELLREDEVKGLTEMPVRSGSLDDKLLREACRPKSAAEAQQAAAKTAEKINESSSELRKANQALVQKDIKRAVVQTPAGSAAGGEKPAPAHAPAPATHAPVKRSSKDSAHHHAHWAYEGQGGPENWGKLKAEFATCAKGTRQSPIDIRDGIRVDQEPIQFDYRHNQFRVLDNGHTIQASLSGSSISVLGKTYELLQFHFHRPAEERINGRAFDMVAHLVHRAADGKLAVVAVLFEKGREHPLIQAVWNNLPLERNQEVMPPFTTINAADLLPERRDYYSYMGSLTTPPCAEDVLWLVMKEQQQMSEEQMAVFARLYANNARPIQPGFGRTIKESR